MTALYSLATSAILGMFLRRFPPDVVPSFWTKFDALVGAGGAVCIDQVHAELKKQSDEPEKWVSARQHMVRGMTAPIFARTQTILRAHYPAAHVNAKMSQADPFVVALAVEEQLIVVSDEQSAPTSKVPKIPDLCQRLGVQHRDVFGLARDQGWKF